MNHIRSTKNLRAVLLATALAASAGLAAGAAEIQRQAGSKWETVRVTRLIEVTNFTPAPQVQLDRYGGQADRRAKATGFFRTEKINGRWWLVDPDGGRFLSVGLNSVNRSQSRDSRDESGPGAAAWAPTTAALLRGNGFNTLGCWSDTGAFAALTNRLPYTAKSEFIVAFARKLGIAKSGFGHWEFPGDCMPLFHPGFEEFCDEHARQLQATKDDPWLIGYFSDNELPFRPESLDNFLALPAEDPGHKAAQKWWDERRRAAAGKLKEKPDDADRAAFLEFLARRYYGVVGAAIRKHDPNHLYLGSRLHGKCISEPVLRGSAAVDVVSVNYYNAWKPDPVRLRSWTQWSGRPVLISEWYAMKLQSPAQETRGAGWRVSTDAARGLFYQHFALGALQSPECIGWHWFKYGGDNEPARGGAEIGLVDVQYRPHDEVFRLMRELNAQAYPLAEHFSTNPKKEETK